MTEDNNQEQVCANCRYYTGSTCHRYPPLVVNSEYIEYESTYSTTSSVWPEVSADDFCGEFKEQQK